MRFLPILLILNFAINTSYAACNPKDIVKKSGYYQYPVDCHVDYGRLRKVEDERKKQVAHLEKSIELKDLAIDTSLKRIEIWQKSTYKLEDRLLTFERNNDKMKWIYFGLGIAVMGLATHGASKLK